MKGFIEWKNRLDAMVEEGIVLTSTEQELWESLQEWMKSTTERFHLEVIEVRDNGDGLGREQFKREVTLFLSTHEVVARKYQRNLFFDIAGSDPTEPKARKLVQEYVAFLEWR